MNVFVRLARERPQADDIALAQRLGVSVGCLRNWRRRGAPPYGRLALAALIARIDPDQILEPLQPSAPRIAAEWDSVGATTDLSPIGEGLKLTPALKVTGAIWTSPTPRAVVPYRGRTAAGELGHASFKGFSEAERK